MKSILRRTYKRYDLAAFSFLIIAIFIFAAGRASAVEPPEPKFLGQKAEQYVVARPATTTTTTTTVPETPKKKAVVTTVASSVPVAPIPVYPGTPQDWLSQAGIPQSDWPEAELLISREGGWRPCVHNGGTIDCSYNGPKAYGIPQSLPGSKMASMGADWRTSPVTQLKWMKAYVEGRYGTWANANRMWESRRPKPWY